MTKLNWNGKIVSSQSEFSVTHRILRHTWPMLCTVMIFYPGKQPKCKNPTCTHLAKRSSTEAKRERCLYCHLFLLLLCDCASTFWGFQRSRITSAGSNSPTLCSSRLGAVFICKKQQNLGNENTKEKVSWQKFQSISNSLVGKYRCSVKAG